MFGYIQRRKENSCRKKKCVVDITVAPGISYFKFIPLFLQSKTANTMDTVITILTRNTVKMVATVKVGSVLSTTYKNRYVTIKISYIYIY